MVVADLDRQRPVWIGGTGRSEADLARFFDEIGSNTAAGIVSYCRPESKVSLGFTEGLNTKIRLIQRRASGIKDLEYLRLKILTSFIPDA